MKRYIKIVLLAVALVFVLSNAFAQPPMTVEIEADDWIVTSPPFSVSARTNNAKATLVADEIVGSGYLVGTTRNQYLTADFFLLVGYAQGTFTTGWVPIDLPLTVGWYLRMLNMDTGDCEGSYSLDWRYIQELP